VRRYPEIYVFLPSLRRSLRLSSAARCAPLLGTDFTNHDASTVPLPPTIDRGTPAWCRIRRNSPPGRRASYTGTSSAPMRRSLHGEFAVQPAGVHVHCWCSWHRIKEGYSRRVSPPAPPSTWERLASTPSMQLTSGPSAACLRDPARTGDLGGGCDPTPSGQTVEFSRPLYPCRQRTVGRANEDITPKTSNGRSGATEGGVLPGARVDRDARGTAQLRVRSR
jgi:hypothetical protein